MDATRQTWNAVDYDRNARFVSDLGQVVLDLLAPKAGERILDLGCGDGALTERIVQTGATVVGIDQSPEFVSAARARGIDARIMDATAMPFVGEFGGHGCVAAIATALRAVCLRRGVTPRLPWHYSTVEEFTAVLIRQGFTPLSVQLIPRPTPLPSGMAAWLRTFAGPVFADLAAAEREPALAEAVDLLRFSLCDERGRWTADYTRLRFVAVVG